jgi:hypothetical protein
MRTFPRLRSIRARMRTITTSRACAGSGMTGRLKDAEGREMVESRHYYHGDQWTEKEIAALRRRKQPVVTSNRIVRKIDAVVGLVERLRQDPKAYARTPKHDEGAELATATLRFVLDNNDWKSKSSRIARAGGIDGISGIEYDLVPGDEGDPASKCTSPMETGSSTTRARSTKASPTPATSA